MRAPRANDVVSATTPPPVADRVGFTGRVLPHPTLPSADDESGLGIIA